MVTPRDEKPMFKTLTLHILFSERTFTQNDSNHNNNKKRSTSRVPKATMGNTDMGEVVEEVSDWDDPMDVAVLLSLNSTSTSSHRNSNKKDNHDTDDHEVVVVRWRPEIMCDVKQHFPQCYLVCDGVASMKMNRITKSSPSLISNDGSGATDDFDIVRFKYNGIIFELSTSCIDAPDKTPESVWWWPNTLSWSSLTLSSTSTSIEKKKTTKTVFAQDRIQDALQLGHMKILSKGKVLYNSDTPTNNDNDPSTISEQLLDIAKSDIIGSSSTSSSSSSTSSSSVKKIKTSLTVMGTPLGKELKEPSTTTKKNRQQNLSLMDILLSPIRIMTFTVRISWLLLQSFLSPFIPGMALPPSSQDGSEDDDSFEDRDGARRRRTTTRPHQE